MRARNALGHDLATARLCLDEIGAQLGGAIGGSRPLNETCPAIARPGLRGGLSPWQLRQVKEHVAANLGRSLTVGELAEAARLSVSHFCRAFKRSTGETPRGFITRQRVQRAQRLMLGGADPLSQIARKCGFADQAHLTRQFRRTLGETPLRWKRAEQARPGA